jgi:hypothetical protein
MNNEDILKVISLDALQLLFDNNNNASVKIGLKN